MSAAGMDKRQLSRRSLYYYLKVLDRDTGMEIGRLVDIHIAGLLLISDHKLESGQQINISVPIGDEALDAGPRSLEVKAQVRWSKQDVNPDYYVSGLQFDNITSKQETLINRLIRTIGFNQ